MPARGEMGADKASIQLLNILLRRTTMARLADLQRLIGRWRPTSDDRWIGLEWNAVWAEAADELETALVVAVVSG